MKHYFVIVPVNGGNDISRFSFVNICGSFLESVEFAHYYDGKIDYSIYDFRNPITSFFNDTLGPEIMSELCSNPQYMMDILPDYSGKIEYDAIHDWLEKICKRKFGENIFAIGLLNHLKHKIYQARSKETLLDRPYIHIVFIRNVRYDVEERYISHLKNNNFFSECLIGIDWIHILNLNVVKKESEQYNLYEYADGNHHYISMISDDLREYLKQSLLVFQEKILIKLIEEVKRNEQRN